MRRSPQDNPAESPYLEAADLAEHIYGVIGIGSIDPQRSFDDFYLMC